MPRGSRQVTSLALALALACASACVPVDPAESGTDATATAGATTTGASTLGDSSTSGTTATTTASTTSAGTTGTTAESTSSSTTADTGDTTGDTTTSDTIGGRGCGDGIAEPGELCFHEVPQDLYFNDFVLADLDEDGHLDVVAAAQIPCPLVDPGDVLASAPSAGSPRDGSTSYELRRGLGDGTGALDFADWLDALDGSQGVDPTVADFDGDGHLDLVVGGRDLDGGTVVFLQGDGAGGFGAPLVSASPVRPVELEAGDVDGDGDLDLVVAGGLGLVVLRGDGSGSFVADPLLTDASHATTILHDLDGDGDLDLVAHRTAIEPAIEALFNPGDGTFTLAQSTMVDGYISDVKRLDPAKGSRPVILVATNEFMVGFRVFALEILDGGALGPPTLVVDGGAEHLVVGRFDGAPRPDTLGFYPELRAVLGEEPWPPAALVLADDAPPLQGRAGVGDLNEDGIDDAIFAGYETTVLLSNP